MGREGHEGKVQTCVWWNKERLIEELVGEEFKSKAAAELFIAKQLDTENTEEFGRGLKKLKKRSEIAITEDMLLDRYLKGIKLSY